MDGNEVSGLIQNRNGDAYSAISITPLATGYTIKNNLIHHCNYGEAFKGIEILRNTQARPSGGVVFNNRIYKIFTDYGNGSGNVYGIYLSANRSAGIGWQVYNNYVSITNQWQTGPVALREGRRGSSIVGIHLDSIGGGRVGVFHNTVYLGGDGRSGNYAFYRRGQGGFDLRLRNNILFNNRSNYAIGNSSPYDWAGSFSNYNLLAGLDTNQIADFGGVQKNVLAWKTISQGDANSWFFTSDRNAPSNHTNANYKQLFVDPENGNLDIKTTDSTVWLVNNRGVSGPDGGITYVGDSIKTDIYGNTRSADSPVGYAPRWGVDLGATNVIPDAGVMPPLSRADINPGQLASGGGLQTYYFGGQRLAAFEWKTGGTRPTRLGMRYWPGIDPDGSILQRRYFFAKWTIENAFNDGANYKYKPQIFYDLNVMGRVEPARESSIKIAYRKTASVQWKVLNGTIDASIRKAASTDSLITGFGMITLTDSIDQIRPSRIDTVKACSGIPHRIYSTPQRNLPYQWSASTTYPQALLQSFGDTTTGNPLVIITNPGPSPIYYQFRRVGLLPGGQILYDTTVLEVYPVPVVNAGPDKRVCSGAPLLIGRDNGSTLSYRWAFDSTVVSGDSTLATPTVTLVNNDTVAKVAKLVMTAKDTASLCPGMDTILVTIDPLPKINLPKDTVYACGGQPSVLSNLGPSRNKRYRWRSVLGSPIGALSDSTTRNPTFNYNVTGVYRYSLYVTDTGTAGLCSNHADVLVKVLTFPQVNTGTNRNACSGQPLQLGALPVPGYNYVWLDSAGNIANGLSSASISNPMLKLINNGTTCISKKYYLKMSAAGSCVAQDSISIQVCPVPAKVQLSDTVNCSGEAIRLGKPAKPGLSYKWIVPSGVSMGADSTQAQLTIKPKYTGPDSVKLILVRSTSNPFGCSTNDSLKLWIRSLPGADAGSDVTLCPGAVDSIGTDSIPGNSYRWHPGLGLSDSTTSWPRVSFKAGMSNAQRYVLTVTNIKTGCQTADTVMVYTRPKPIIAINKQQNACSGDSISLQTGKLKKYTYRWTALETGGTLLGRDSAKATAIRFNTTGADVVYRYKIQVKDSSGCSASDTLTLTLKPAPKPDAGTDKALCNTDTATLGAGSQSSSGNTYTWQGSVKGLASLSARNVPRPIYTALNTDTLDRTDTLIVYKQDNTTGCKATDTVLVKAKARVRNTPILPGRSTVCPGTQGVVFTARPARVGQTYAWRMASRFGTISPIAGSNQVSVNFSAVIDTAILYVTPSINGCAGPTDSAKIVLNNILTPSVRTGPKAICSSNLGLVQTYKTDSVPGSFYHWRTNALGTQTSGDSSFKAGIIWSGAIGQTGKLWLEERNGSCRGKSDTLYVPFYQSPDTNRQIKGNASICKASLPQRLRFNVSRLQHQGASWTVPAGIKYSIITTDTTSELQLDTAATGNYNISVSETDTFALNATCPGKSISRKLIIFPKPAISAAAGTGTGITTAWYCGSDAATTHTFKTDSATAQRLGYKYTWYVLGGTQVSGDSSFKAGFKFTPPLPGASLPTIAKVWVLPKGQNPAQTCLASDTLRITLYPSPDTSKRIQGHKLVCKSSLPQRYAYAAKASAGARVNWTLPNTGVQFHTLSTADSSILVIDTAATGTLTIGVQEKDSLSSQPSACAGNYQTISIKVYPKAQIKQGPLSLCASEAAIAAAAKIYKADSLITQTFGYQYHWKAIGATQVSGDSSFKAGFTFAAPAPGQSSTIAKLWLETPRAGCKVSDTLQVTVYASPDTSKRIAGQGSICNSNTAGINNTYPRRYSFASKQALGQRVSWNVPTGIRYTVLTTADSSILRIDSANAGTYTLSLIERDSTSGQPYSCAGKVISTSIKVYPQVKIASYPTWLCGPDAGTTQNFVADAQSQAFGYAFNWHSDRGTQVSGGNTGNAGFTFAGITGKVKVWLEPTSGPCAQADTVTISIVPGPDAGKRINGPNAICAGNAATYRFAVKKANRQGATWQTSPNNGLIISQSSSPDSSFITLQTNGQSSTTYTLSVQEHDTSSFGVCQGTIITYAININPKPAPAVAPHDSVICFHNQTSNTYSVSNANAQSTYSWRVQGGNVIGLSNASSINIAWDSTSTLPARLYLIETSNQGCPSEELTIRFHKDSTNFGIDYVSISETDPSKVEVYLKANRGSKPVRIQRRTSGKPWTTIASQPAGNAAQTITDAIGKTIDSVYEYRAASTDACNFPLGSDLHNTILLQGSANDKGANLSWNSYKVQGNRLNAWELLRRTDGAAEASYERSGDIAQTTTILTDNGKDGFSQTFRLKQEGSGISVFSSLLTLKYENSLLPYNTITPDGDGHNDYFDMEFSRLYPDNELTIFNRWGAQIGQFSHYKAGDWDASALPAGTYYYILTANGADTKRGYVVVVKK